jgi:hypothetical protein
MKRLVLLLAVLAATLAFSAGSASARVNCSGGFPGVSTCSGGSGSSGGGGGGHTTYNFIFPVESSGGSGGPGGGSGGHCIGFPNATCVGGGS